MTKKLLMFLPLSIWLALLTGILKYGDSAPTSGLFYVVLFLNIAAAVLMLLKYRIGVLFGVVSGAYLYLVSTNYLKFGFIESILGLIYMALYVLIYLVCFRNRDKA